MEPMMPRYDMDMSRTHPNMAGTWILHKKKSEVLDTIQHDMLSILKCLCIVARNNIFSEFMLGL